MNESLADILNGDFKLGRTPRRIRGSDKTPKSEDRR